MLWMNVNTFELYEMWFLSLSDWTHLNGKDIFRLGEFTLLGDVEPELYRKSQFTQEFHFIGFV